MKKIFAILLAAAMCAGVSACTTVSDSGSASAATSTTSMEESKSDESKAPAEANTSAKVDEICLKAMNEAKTMEKDEATVIWDAGFAYFKEHSENIFENNEVMENMMYYGQFIYSYIEANATDINNLVDSTQAAYDAGWNALKAVKYVYRGADKIEDDSTQNALNEFKTSLAKLK